MSDRGAPPAAEWRLGRGWSEGEIRRRLEELSGLERNFDPGTLEGPTPPPGWERYGSTSRVGVEAPGPPGRDGAFARGATALGTYAFSDPSIVEAHYHADVPLEGRPMLLELKPMFLRYLCPVVVSAVRDEAEETRAVFGFRYDTLEGHVERGYEWFLLEKDAATGALDFRIEATWKEGSFPNGWSRIGFRLLARRYQRTWHRRAHRRMAAVARGAPGPGKAGGLRGGGAPPEVTFTTGRGGDDR